MPCAVPLLPSPSSAPQRNGAMSARARRVALLHLDQESPTGASTSARGVLQEHRLFSPQGKSRQSPRAALAQPFETGWGDCRPSGRRLLDGKVAPSGNVGTTGGRPPSRERRTSPRRPGRPGHEQRSSPRRQLSAGRDNLAVLDEQNQRLRPWIHTTLQPVPLVEVPATSGIGGMHPPSPGGRSKLPPWPADERESKLSPAAWAIARAERSVLEQRAAEGKAAELKLAERAAELLCEGRVHMAARLAMQQLPAFSTPSKGQTQRQSLETELLAQAIWDDTLVDAAAQALPLSPRPIDVASVTPLPPPTPREEEVQGKHAEASTAAAMEVDEQHFDEPMADPHAPPAGPTGGGPASPMTALLREAERIRAAERKQLLDAFLMRFCFGNNARRRDLAAQAHADGAQFRARYLSPHAAELEAHAAHARELLERLGNVLVARARDAADVCGLAWAKLWQHPDSPRGAQRDEAETNLAQKKAVAAANSLCKAAVSSTNAEEKATAARAAVDSKEKVSTTEIID
jgi:hypothetical protein